MAAVAIVPTGFTVVDFGRAVSLVQSANNRTEIPEPLAGGNPRVFQRLDVPGVNSTFNTFLYIGLNQTSPESNNGEDLSDDYEATGSITIAVGGDSITFDVGGTNLAEVYNYGDPGAAVRQWITDNVINASPAPDASDFIVTLNDGTGTDHAVDADPVTVAYAVPAAAVSHTSAPDIAIADFDQAGLRPPIILAVFLADISGNFLTGTGNNVQPIEGEIDVSATLTFGRIERRSGNTIRLYRDSGSTDPASDYFDDPGSPLYPTAKMYIQTTAGRAEYDAGNGVNNANFFLASGEDATIVSGISTGGYFLIAIAEPTVEHAVNAAPTTVAYAVPAAAITHTPRTLVAYAVDADPMSPWPTRSRNQASRIRAGLPSTTP